MHFRTEILFPAKPDNLEAEVAAAMDPFREEWNPEIGRYDGWWDWWQIGGRWTGAHSAEYDPRKDPENMEMCSVCGGTGKRLDMYIESGCNGCSGEGERIKWPTDWKHHESDVIRLADLADDQKSCNLVIVNGDSIKVVESETWDGKNWVGGEYKDRTIKQQLEHMGVTDGWLVTVDCHS